MCLCQCTCLCLHTSGTTSCFKRYCFNKKKYLVMLASLDSSAPPVSAFQVVGITVVGSMVCATIPTHKASFSKVKRHEEGIFVRCWVRILIKALADRIWPHRCQHPTPEICDNIQRCGRWYPCYRIKTRRLSGLLNSHMNPSKRKKES